MKHLSIKTRVIFWYSFSMLFLFALVLSLMSYAGSKAASDDARGSLITSTDMAVNNVTVHDGRLIIDDDFVYYMDHTWVVLYKNEDLLLSGTLPEGFPEDVPFTADKIHKAGQGINTYYVYDRLIENPKTGRIWIRGMTPASVSVRDPAIHALTRVMVFVLPLLIALSLIGGWIITRRAFLPLKKINDTVAMIQEGSDLTKRIGQEDDGAHDEIYTTAQAFDRMLDRISRSFEREKQFTDDASHELRTPTAVIMAQCEYALDNFDDPGQVKEAVEGIYDQAKKMSSLIDQLLMLARADRDQVTLHKEKTDLSLLAEEAAFLHRNEADQKNISITVEAEEGIYATVDATLISQALSNLISNAVKYGKEGGRVEVCVRKVPDDGADVRGVSEGLPTDDSCGPDRVLLKVTDDGIGIREEDLDKIWDRFYRADHCSDIPGLGLGLSLTKWIAEAHGGEIRAESRPNEYTSITLLLDL